MQRIGKLALWVVGGVLVVFAAGWMWGMSGKSELSARASRAESRADVLQARSYILQARVDLYNVNFGDASRNLEASKPALDRLTARLKADGAEDLAGRAGEALNHVGQAQQLAGKLDQAANTSAAAAIEALDKLPMTAP